MKKAKAASGGKKNKGASFDLWERITSAMHNETISFIIGAVLAAVAIYSFIVCLSFIFTGGADQSLTDSAGIAVSEAANSGGTLGARLSQMLINEWFGLPSLLLLFFMLMTGCNLMKISHIKLGRTLISCAFLTVWLSVFLSMTLTPLLSDSFISPGGNHGLNAELWLRKTVGLPGTILILLVTLLLYCIWLTRRTIDWIRNRFSFKHSINESVSSAVEEFSSLTGLGNRNEEETGVENQSEPSQGDEPADRIVSEATKENEQTEFRPFTDIDNDSPSDEDADSEHGSEDIDMEPRDVTESDTGSDIELTVVESKEEEMYEGKLPQQKYNPRLDLENYKIPTPDLLKQYDDTVPTDNRDEQQTNKNRIINVLRSFGIEITSISATQGPTVTLYEITPAEGIRISKIRNLEDDIALNLAAYGIRIIAPIPGKGTIGIEVPNANPVVVPMQPLIKSKKFVESKYELPVVIGKTITNEVFMFDLAKSPHLLVAGATGMGKSVGLNAIVTSLLYKKHPAEMKLVMVDPKMVEFSIYSSIDKHYLAKLPDSDEAIITDPTKVVHTLKSLCTEMDSRYELLKDAQVRSVIEYNNKFIDRKLNPQKGHRYLPYIVVVIDEFGDLIMTAGKEIETPICRIAQKARAVGIHMIIATQRPTTNIITGTIKANFPARIAFRVTSMIDSRTILDRPGANQLIGRGDMLYSTGGDPQRVQCAFVDTPEVQEICNFISRQPGYLTPYELPEYVDENEQGSSDGESLAKGDLDPIFEDAARLIVSSQQGSTSLIQRKFKIGYNRAGRIMDQLERAGIVSAQEGSKPRQVLCIDNMELDQKLEGLL